MSDNWINIDERKPGKGDFPCTLRQIWIIDLDEDEEAPDPVYNTWDGDSPFHVLVGWKVTHWQPIEPPEEK